MGKLNIKNQAKFKLTPRWIPIAYALRGWVVIHSKITGQIDNVRHLSHVKITCVETGKTIFCRIFGPGSSQSSEYRQKYGNNIETSICLDAYYQQKLDIPYINTYGPKQDEGNNQYTFNISPVGFIGKIRAALAHPEDGIRLGMTIAMASLAIGLFSLIVGLVSLVVSLLSKAS